MLKGRYSLFASRTSLLALGAFAVLALWWLVLSPFSPTPETESARNIWGGIYQIMAYLGGISGLLISHKWGGLKSLLGRSVMAFSIGLLCQGFGQTVYTYYLFTQHIAAPYPSLGDLGYFGTIPFYVYGAVLLAKVSGVKISLKSYTYKLQALFIPILMLLISYVLFLREYVFDFSAPVKTFLDFGYPMGQAIYVSIAILTFVLSRNILGGIMRRPILFFLFALVLQYLCDYIFLYQFNAGNWYVGGINDFMYLTSYFLMTLALIYLGQTFNKIKDS